MTTLTPDGMRYIEDGFFDDSRNTHLDFEKMLKVYGDLGFDEIIKNIGPVIPEEYNERRAVYSFPGKTARKYGNDPDTVDRIHKEKGLTKYDISDDGITRKNPGMESDFENII